jgi:hypothetical protein
MAKTLKKLSRSKIKTFKIKNRRGYAAVCFNNLTEGPTLAEAIRRMSRPLNPALPSKKRKSWVKRQGYVIA